MNQEMFDCSQAWVNAHDPSPVYRVGNANTVTYQFASRSSNPPGNNWPVTFCGRFAFYAHSGPAHFEADVAPDASEV